MKAHVKINVSIQLEPDDTDPKQMVKYPLSTHHAGVVVVTDRDEAVRVITSLSNHINRTFEMMSVKPAIGEHKPDLALAHGGDPEPTDPEVV